MSLRNTQRTQPLGSPLGALELDFSNDDVMASAVVNKNSRGPKLITNLSHRQGVLEYQIIDERREMPLLPHPGGDDTQFGKK